MSSVTCREVLEYYDTLNIGEYQFVLFWTYLLWWVKAMKSKIICFTGVYIL